MTLREYCPYCKSVLPCQNYCLDEIDKYSSTSLQQIHTVFNDFVELELLGSELRELQHILLSFDDFGKKIEKSDEFQADYYLIKDYWENPRLQKFWDEFLEEEASCWQFLNESQPPFRDIKCFFNIDEDGFRINKSLWGNNIGFNDDLLEFKDNEELKLYFFKEKAIFRQDIINRRQNVLDLEMTYF